MAAYAQSFQSDAPPEAVRGYDLADYVKKFEDAEDTTSTARAQSEKSRDYVDNKHYTAAEITAIKAAGQAPLCIPRIKQKTDFMRGYEQKMRTDPKALPRTPKHEKDSEAATDVLRFIGDSNRFDQIRSAVFEHLYVEGYGGCDVTVEPDRQGKVKVKLLYVPWDRLFYDPHSRMPDFSDARYFGMVVWMDRADALAMAKTPEAKAAVESTLTGSDAASRTYDDRPAHASWTDNRRTRVRIVQMWCREPDDSWHLVKFTKGGLIEGPEKPYQDEAGKSVPSLVLQSAYVDRENNRYGEVWTMIDMQDELNKRRSKALALFSTRQTRSEKGAVKDINEVKRELAKPNGHIETNKGFAFEILPTGDMAAGQFELLQQITMEFDRAGPNASMAGKDTRAQSGRAIIAQQTGGMIEAELLIDRLKDWSRRVYEAAWLRVRQFWTAEEWVRVTDDEDNLKWVGLNQPVTLAQAIAEMQQQDPERAAMVMQRMGLQPNDPRLMQVIEVRNRVAEMDVDISIDSGPDVATIMQEEFAQAAEMAQAGVPIPPEMLVELSNLRSGRKKSIKESMQQAQQAQGQAQQQAHEAKLAESQAKTRKDTADAANKEADAMTKGAQLIAATSAPQPVMGDPNAPPPMEDMGAQVA
jgi:hypothetical protein